MSSNSESISNFGIKIPTKLTKCLPLSGLSFQFYEDAHLITVFTGWWVHNSYILDDLKLNEPGIEFKQGFN